MIRVVINRIITYRISKWAAERRTVSRNYAIMPLLQVKLDKDHKRHCTRNHRHAIETGSEDESGTLS
jgi:hypothetical protein